ncbi:hypothetical protein B0H13DRAFT_402367 [Mycena leptocephala]|nr:hypothetical protein B0H13DRAFT_402367 [Mycena leptocephala]
MYSLPIMLCGVGVCWLTQRFLFAAPSLSFLSLQASPLPFRSLRFSRTPGLRASSLKPRSHASRLRARIHTSLLNAARITSSKHHIFSSLVSTAPKRPRLGSSSHLPHLVPRTLISMRRTSTMTCTTAAIDFTLRPSSTMTRAAAVAVPHLQ